MARQTFSSGAGVAAIVVNDREWYSTGYRRRRFWIAFIIASDNVASTRHDLELSSGPSHRAGTNMLGFTQSRMRKSSHRSDTCGYGSEVVCPSRSRSMLPVIFVCMRLVLVEKRFVRCEILYI
jgi:hypothetical protein